MMRLGEQLGPQHLPEKVSDDMHPVIRHMRTRQLEGSQRGQRDDDRTIALVVEGGGHRGVISAGMLGAIEAMDLMPAVDVIYGVSSGALNGSYAAAGQAAQGATNYEDTATRTFTNRARLLLKQPVIDFDFLFVDVIQNRKPYNEAGLAAGPDFRAVATDTEAGTTEILRDFTDVQDLSQGVRVSCAVPIVSGPSLYRGRTMVDGGLLAPLPHRKACEDEATDVLVLRTRPAASRKQSLVPAGTQELLYRTVADKSTALLLAYQPYVYNRQAEDLEQLSRAEGPVFQIAPDKQVPHISRTEHSLAKVQAGLRAGAVAAAKAFGVESRVDLLWQPTPYLVK